MLAVFTQYTIVIERQTEWQQHAYTALACNVSRVNKMTSEQTLRRIQRLMLMTDGDVNNLDDSIKQST